MNSRTKTYKIITLLLTFVFAITFHACKKKTEAPKTVETGTMTDGEGNVYATVKIGDKWWMAENLRVTKFRNGVPLSTLQQSDPDSAWGAKTKGFYCMFYNNSQLGNQYGYLYNWYAVADTSNIAPAGWHVPSDAEWKDLERNLGMSDVDGVNWRGGHEGDKLKVKSPQDWTTYGTVWSTNESGFTALAGSCRLFNGTWGYPATGGTGFWWSSTLRSPSNEPWYRYLDYKRSGVFRYYGPKSYGMSIRCVMD